MDLLDTSLLALLVFVAAVLYSAVGHGGASGYLAAMALVGTSPAIIRPTALTLNLAVSLIATVKFVRAGCFSWRLFWPFAVTSIPAAYIGGRIELPTQTYRVLVGIVLLYAAARLWMLAKRREETAVAPPPYWIAFLLGAVVGLLSGLTGVGGGIFLSPLMLLLGWAGARVTSGVAALFIFVNSAAGLAGRAGSGDLARIGELLMVLVPAAVVGGWIGSEYGSRRLPPLLLRRCLAVVLVLAGAKMILAR